MSLDAKSPIDQAGGKFTAKFLRSCKFSINTLIDVGVFRGTPQLYAAFEQARKVLIDPLPNTPAEVQLKHGHRYTFDFHTLALGRKPGTLTFHLAGAASGANGTRPNDPRAAGTISVEVETLDNLIQRTSYAPPFGLKVDTEGSELDVLRGASKTLKNCEFVILETTVRKRFENDYRFSEIVAIMAKHGFELLTVLNDKPGLNRFYDCLFVRADHPIFGRETATADTAIAD